MKKIVTLILASVLTLSCAVPCFAEKVTPAANTLKFGADGKFKIMMFADSQDDQDLEESTTQLMCEALDKYKPDLVIYLGDNTVAEGYENQKKAIEAVTAPVCERNIPYSIVFGNHDQEFGVSKEDLLKIYQNCGNCLTRDAVPDVYGCGNCNLPIMSSDGSKIAFNLWCIDSGSSNPDKSVGGYDYVHEDQISWYKRTANELKAQNDGKPVPAMNFQHVIIPEIYDKIHVELPFSLGDMTYHYFGKEYFFLPVFSRLNGYWLEECCPPRVYDGQLDAWVETGDVIAAFNGHDHNNSINVNIKGVDVVNVPTVGCNSYYKDVTRGAGLITLDEKDLSTYDYEIVHIYDLALDKNSKICDAKGAGSKSHYAAVKALDTLVMGIFKLILNPINKLFEGIGGKL